MFGSCDKSPPVILNTVPSICTRGGEPFNIRAKGLYIIVCMIEYIYIYKNIFYSIY